MSWKRAIPWVLLFVAVAVFAVDRFGGGGQGAPPPGGRAAGLVTRVVDGDTVHVRIDGADERVRFIGVDTPETVKPGTPVQCFGKAASAYDHRLLDGQAVRLRFDSEQRDRYGRLLAYVYRARDGLFVNAALVRGGYATTLTIPPNTAHAAQFAGLERRARERQRGLWRACPAG
jgi:micrococcal nuclease